MRMLRSMCGVTKKDKIRNVHVRESVKSSGRNENEDHRENVVRTC